MSKSDSSSDKPSGQHRRPREASTIYGQTSSSRSSGRIREVALAILVVGLAAGGITWFRNNRQDDAAARVSLIDSSTNPQVTSGENAATEISSQAHLVLQKRCGQCHAVDMVAGTLNVARHETLIAPDASYVVAGNLKDSILWDRMGVQTDMPPEDAESATPEEIAIVERWIEEGAAPFPTEALRPQIAEADVWAAVLADLESHSLFERPYLRYFSFVHLHNNSFGDRIGRNNTDYSEKNLSLARVGLSKLLNSLSWMSEIVVPEAIDQERLIFRIDLRDFDWDKRKVWQRLENAYPYGLDLTVSANETLRETAEQLYELSGSKLPVIRGDWFIDTAPRGDLYYDILQLPKTVHELEHMLGVDVIEDFVDNRLRRAGFTESGVSQSNRLVDRHETESGGYYWKSYDFGKSESRGNLFKFPLGPKFAGNEFDEFAFEADGGEMIFTLPNGLQGYFLALQTGERIELGPVDVVRDSKETSGTPAVANAISCMACHQRGMIRFRDTVRPSRSVPLGEVRLKVDELFAAEDEMNEILDADSATFMAALNEAMAPFQSSSENPDTLENESGEEPIGTIARYYQKDLELEDVAAEVGHNDPEALAALIRSNSRLRELGLAPLTEGAAIKRSTWASTEESLFHALASELEIGIAVK